MERLWIGSGGVLGAIAVMLAAAGAHGLEARGPAVVQDIRSAAQIAGWHALALLAVGLWAGRGGRIADLAGAGFLLGTLIFIAAVVGNAFGVEGIVRGAPVGGTLLIAAWVLLAASAAFAR